MSTESFGIASLFSEEEPLIDLLKEWNNEELHLPQNIESFHERILARTSNFFKEPALSNRIILATDAHQLNESDLHCLLTTLRTVCADEKGSAFFNLIERCLRSGNQRSAEQTLRFMLKHEVLAKQQIEEYVSRSFAAAVQENNLGLVKSVYNLPTASQGQITLDVNALIWDLTPLHCAAGNGNLEILTFLLKDKRVNLKATTRNGETALHLAIPTGDEELIGCLLKAGIDPNAQDENGNSALHRVGLEHQRQRFGRDKADTILEMLKAHKGNPNLKNLHDFTPIRFLLSLSSTSLEALLANANGLKKTNDRPYEGLSPEYPVLKVVKESLSRIPKKYLPCSRSALMRAFLPPLNEDPIRKGQAVILKAGWQGHAVYLLFCQGYLIIGNRGEGSEDVSTIKAFKIDLQRIPDGLLEDIAYHKHNVTAKEGKNYLYEELPLLLRAVEDEWCKLIGKHLSNKSQKVGNCAMNVKSTLRALLFFLLEEKGGSTVQNLKLSRDVSRTWSTYFRLEILNRYLDEDSRRRDFDKLGKSGGIYLFPERDENLIKKVMIKLRKRKDFEELLQFFPNVQEYVRSQPSSSCLVS